MSWRSRLEAVLYAGEEVREAVDAGRGGVLVTTHRVLAYAPDREGAPFREAPVLNVESVRRGNDANLDLVLYSLRLGTVGGLLLAVGAAIDFSTVVGGQSAEGVETVGLDGVFALLSLFALLNGLLVAAGALLLLAAVALGAVYWYLREPVLVVEVADPKDDVRVPPPANAEAAVSRLERAIPDGEELEPTPAANGRSRPDDRRTGSPDGASRTGERRDVGAADE